MRKNYNKRGVTLIEVVVVVVILALLTIIGIGLYTRQLNKGYDGRRKADLKRLKQAFEDYYNDFDCYPPTDTLERYCNGDDIHVLDDYLKQVPCDPQTKKAYLYRPYPDNSQTCGGFRIYATLYNEHDTDIERLNCNHEDGCGAGEASYNYGVSVGVPVSYHTSGDTPDTSTPPTATPTPSTTCGSGLVSVCCETNGTCNSYGGGSCSGTVCYGDSQAAACSLCP